MRLRLFLGLAVLALLPLLVAGCGAAPAAAQPPNEYLSNALHWIESHSIMAPHVDFAAARAEALALIPAPTDTTATHAAIRHALADTRDGLAWLFSPNDSVQAYPGMSVTYPELVVNWVEPGLMGQHRTNGEIATRLSLSDKTVRNHVSNIFSKLQVADRAEAIIRAREAGITRTSENGRVK